MRRTILLCIPLALAAAAAPAGARIQDTAPADQATTTVGELAALEAEYAKALVAWKTRYDEAEGRARVDLRKEHPAYGFWDRFEALGKAGEGRAYLWLADSVRHVGLGKDEKGPVLQVIYAALLEGHVADPWFDQVVGRLVRHARYLGEDEVLRWLTDAGAKVEPPMTKALITVKQGQILARSRDKERKARGEAMLEAYSKENILPGATALDFKASTIDGHDFNLSDYRGKAVLVDFYGFW